jgi:hypothetical protein
MRKFTIYLSPQIIVDIKPNPLVFKAMQECNMLVASTSTGRLELEGLRVKRVEILSVYVCTVCTL